MGHDTNHGHATENKTIISFKNSFWLVVIIVGLFIAALNFIQAESGGEEGKAEGKEATTEMHATAEHGEHAEKAEEKKAEEAPKAAEAAKTEEAPKAEAEHK